jgi:uncharacterized protein
VTAIEPTSRTTVRRHRERADYDRDSVYAILDEGFICHVACSVEGTLWMIPTTYGRRGHRLYIHGAAANHVLKAAAAGAEVTVSVTLVDGMVLARSTFHHSMNYRSVTIFGTVTDITEAAEKEAALACIVDHMLPGRSDEARSPSPIELTKTRVVSLPLDEVSAKVRTGGPLDDDEDLALPVWAGVLPLRLAAGPPQPDGGHPPTVGPSPSMSQPQRWGA